jgi:predicted transcriptional regulator
VSAGRWADRNNTNRLRHAAHALGVELGLQFRLDKVMAQPTTRDRIVEALKDLPEDATFQDAIERLVFLAKIDIGLAELDAGKGITHNEVKRRLGM